MMHLITPGMAEELEFIFFGAVVAGTVLIGLTIGVLVSLMKRANKAAKLRWTKA